MESRRVRVDGIPSDIPASRVKDKLAIHFLRTKFGGVEVKNVDVVQGAAAYAIVTFHHDQVVDLVLKIKDHPLQVNDKIYDLVISEVNGNFDLDEVFERLSLTVNYKKFPEKYQSLLKNLMETHESAMFDFDEESMICTISGPYAEILYLAQEILSKLGIVLKTQKQISADSQRKSEIERRKNDPEPLGTAQASDYTYAPLPGTAVKETYSEKKESLEQLQEPFIWETDIFKYLLKFHLTEYQDIQNRYHVLAEDENYDDVTAIYLETESGGKTHLGDFKCARSELMVLYQGLELLLRKEQIKKSIYRDQEFYDILTTHLKRLYPMLHCHADERNLYLLGYGVDVSAAKRYILELHTNFDRVSSNLDKQFGASNLSAGLPHSSSPTKKHESGVGSRIAALFNAPTTQSLNSAKSHVDEEHLVSSTSPRIRTLERENERDMIALKSNMADDLQKYDVATLSWADEKSESMAMPSVRRPDVPPALKIVRGDLGNSRAPPKPTGILKPVQFTKASSQLPYSVLGDISPPWALPEVKPRRSNSLSRVYSKGRTSTETHSHTLVFKDEVDVTDWQWHYITQVCKSDLDIWSSEVELTIETNKQGKVALKMKSFDRNRLTSTKKMIQLLCCRLDISITHCYFEYALLGVQGPEDPTLLKWCDLFRKCSRELSVKSEKDKLVLLYPKEIQAHVLDAYRQHKERRMKSSGDATMPDIGQVTLQDRFVSSTDEGVDYITKRKRMSSGDATMPDIGQVSLQDRYDSSATDEGEDYIIERKMKASGNATMPDIGQVSLQDRFESSTDEGEDYIIEHKMKSSGDATMPDIGQVSLQDRYDSSATDEGEDYIIERKMKASGDATMPDIGQVSLQDRYDSSATDLITERKQSLSDKQRTRPKHEALPFLLGGEEMDEEEIYLDSKHLSDEKYTLGAGTESSQRITAEHEAFIIPGSLEEKSTHPKELQDTNNRSTSEKTGYYTLTETFPPSPYTCELLTQNINVSSPNVGLEADYDEQGVSTEDGIMQYEDSSPQLRTPAVGQESDTNNSICDQCKNIGKTVQTSSGQMQCVKCFAASVITALNEAAKAPLRASMSHTAMSLRLPGYEKDTSLKIIYEVPDGVQGVGDPQPGCQYKGGRFEAYLPDNRKGRKLLSLLQRALDQGLIFQVKAFETGEEVTWYKIPHKTSPDGGKAKNGFPDSTYVRDTITLLYQYGID
ncbi:uncharacterized protein LOC130296986 [Hyla sarda]|uniref:uncharacterized protein LOC130296986 n=1 Tax=Hyla sarda TaxID=327740 RepID=UPI0024C40066|nr:uncharacterized protein LOC130296986 [Hyla sarda]